MAREHPRYANFEFGEYEFCEYPMMVYPGAKDPKKPYGANGKPLKGIIVNSDDERDQALGLGKYAPAKDEPADDDKADDVETVTAPTLVPTGSPGVERLETEADVKKALLEEADTLGVQVDKRWSTARIQDAIDTHKSGNEVV